MNSMEFYAVSSIAQFSYFIPLLPHSAIDLNQSTFQLHYRALFHRFFENFSAVLWRFAPSWLRPVTCNRKCTHECAALNWTQTSTNEQTSDRSFKLIRSIIKNSDERARRKIIFTSLNERKTFGGWKTQMQTRKADVEKRINCVQTSSFAPCHESPDFPRNLRSPAFALKTDSSYFYAVVAFSPKERTKLFFMIIFMPEESGS